MPLPPASVLFLLATFVYLGIRGYFKRKMAGASDTVSRSSAADMTLVGLVVVGQIILPMLAIFSPWLDAAGYEAPGAARTAAGTLLMAAGLWLFWRSHADLGENWSVTLAVQATHTLVSHGVYERVRHPMYASFFLMAIGQLLLIANWIAGPAALIAVALLYVVRKPNEEAMLLEQFGADYRRYMASTGGVIPKFGRRSAHV